MNRAFNVDISDISDISILSDNLKFDEKKISEFFQEEIPEKEQNGKKVLDGKKIEDSWFRPVVADFFISHKHEDVEKAKELGAYLQSKGKTVFIDSCIWKNIADLQKRIDDDYCLNSDGKLYEYKKVMKSTSYTHMLLANALLKTISNCKNFIFLNTKNSIQAENIIENTSETNSPWLYFEIDIANALLKKCITENFSRSQEQLPEMSFEIDLSKFEKVNVTEFLEKMNLDISNRSNWNPDLGIF